MSTLFLDFLKTFLLRRLLEPFQNFAMCIRISSFNSVVFCDSLAPPEHKLPSQVLVAHSPDFLCVSYWLCPIAAVVIIAFINVVSNLHRASQACTLSHIHSPFGGCLAYLILICKEVCSDRVIIIKFILLLSSLLPFIW